MGARLIGGVGDLARDLEGIVTKARTELPGVVRDGIKAGTVLAKANAKKSAGKHGKRYPTAITSQMGRGFRGFGASVYQGEYGPDSARPQGGMSFEFGSRNQKPHLDLAKSADIIGPQFEREVGKVVDRWFW